MLLVLLLPNNPPPELLVLVLPNNEPPALFPNKDVVPLLLVLLLVFKLPKSPPVLLLLALFALPNNPPPDELVLPKRLFPVLLFALLFPNKLFP